MAVAAAAPITLIQGPPGTGKTEAPQGGSLRVFQNLGGGHTKKAALTLLTTGVGSSYCSRHVGTL